MMDTEKLLYNMFCILLPLSCVLRLLLFAIAMLTTPGRSEPPPEHSLPIGVSFRGSTAMKTDALNTWPLGDTRLRRSVLLLGTSGLALLYASSWIAAIVGGIRMVLGQF